MNLKEEQSLVNKFSAKIDAVLDRDKLFFDCLEILSRYFEGIIILTRCKNTFQGSYAIGYDQDEFRCIKIDIKALPLVIRAFVQKETWISIEDNHDATDFLKTLQQPMMQDFFLRGLKIGPHPAGLIYADTLKTGYSPPDLDVLQPFLEKLDKSLFRILKEKKKKRQSPQIKPEDKEVATEDKEGEIKPAEEAATETKLEQADTAPDEDIPIDEIGLDTDQDDDNTPEEVIAAKTEPEQAIEEVSEDQDSTEVDSTDQNDFELEIGSPEIKSADTQSIWETAPDEEMKLPEMEGEENSDDQNTPQAKLQRLLDGLWDFNPTVRQKNFDQLLEVGEEALPLLIKSFPGPLFFNRHLKYNKFPSVDQHGPVLALLLKLGDLVIPDMLKITEVDDAEERFYAIYMFSKLKTTKLIPYLFKRLTDEDHKIVNMSCEILYNYRNEAEFTQYSTLLEEKLNSPTIEQKIEAAYCMSKIKHPEFVPQLITCLRFKNQLLAEVCQRALLEITKQNFGLRPKKWNKWWEKNKACDRVAWIIEGLSMKDANIRLSAIEELSIILKDTFDYDYSAPPKQRQQAIQKIKKWWQQNSSKPSS